MRVREHEGDSNQDKYIEKAIGTLKVHDGQQVTATTLFTNLE
jgi:hypothetical protein